MAQEHLKPRCKTSGEVRVAAGESLLVIGTTPFHSNFGKIEAIGGSMEFVGALTNIANVGLITGRNATFRFRNGLTNNGSLMLSFGTSDVSGDITNSATGKNRRRRWCGRHVLR